MRVVIKIDSEDVTDEMLQKINAATESLQTENITLINATLGSIIFTVTVCWSGIQGEENFIQEIVLFLQQALQKAGKTLGDYSTVVVFVEPSTNNHIGKLYALFQSIQKKHFIHCSFVFLSA